MSAHAILYVEDDANEAFFLTRALKKLGFHNPIHHLEDGQQAINYLSGAQGYGERSAHPLPAAMLLDLKMPGLDGFEVLRWVRSQPQFQHLPVVVLTASSLSADKDRAAALGATAFLTKSFNWTEVFNTLHQVLLQNYVQPPAQAGNPETPPRYP